MNHLRSNVCCHTSTKNILPNKLKLAWIGRTCEVLHSLSVCTAISRKLVEECIRPRFQAFAPVVHINGRHYLNVTTQNAQQKEHLKSQFLKEQSLVSILLLQLSLRLISSTHWCCCKMNDPLEHSLTVLQGGKTDGREESCSCYSRLHARHAVRFRPATGSRIHRVLWVLRQLLPWLQGGQPSVALHNQVRGVLRRQLTRGARRRIRSSICSAAETGDGKRRLLLHSNLALINFVFAYKFFIFLCPCIWICQGQLMQVLQQLALMIAPWTGNRTRTSTLDNDWWWFMSCQWIMRHELTVHNYRR